ncbi:MAG: hypothetical protein IPM39_12500 [Chloroflexi bacterium]|nr:hypothetical protein [Chloroflexota bacterium]
MFKKLFLGTLFGLVTLLLIVGGVNRTLDKLGDANEPLGQQVGSSVEAADHEENDVVAAENWQTAVATVTNIRANGLWLELADGTQARARRAAWEYAQSQGFSAAVGDAIRLTGYRTADGFEIVALRHETTGAEVRLRDENGRSLWGGHGAE